MAKGSSVPAWPTLVLRGQLAALGGDDVVGGDARRLVDEQHAVLHGRLRQELLGELGAQEGDELGELQVGREPRRPAVPAAALGAGDARDVDAVVRGAQRDLAARRGVVGEQVAHEARDRGALDGAQVVDERPRRTTRPPRSRRSRRA